MNEFLVNTIKIQDIADLMTQQDKLLSKGNI